MTCICFDISSRSGDRARLTCFIENIPDTGDPRRSFRKSVIGIFGAKEKSCGAIRNSREHRETPISTHDSDLPSIR